MAVAAPSVAHAASIHAGAAALGERLGRELAGWPLPLIALQSHFSLLEGVLSPTAWGEALAAFHAAHGGGGGRWALVADRNDLLGLPACIQAWGSGRVAVGASLLARATRNRDGEHQAEARLPDRRDAPPSITHETELLLFAPTRMAYRRLCRLLSWRHEHPDEWRRWQDGDDRASADCSGLVALVRDAGWLSRLRDAGAEVAWRAGLHPAESRPGVVAIAAPIFTHISPASMTSDPILAALRSRQAHGNRPLVTAKSPRSSCLTDLALMQRSYLGHEDQLRRGSALLERCAYVPGEDGLHMPPSDYGDADALLRHRVEAGFVRRYGLATPATLTAARARLERELSVISLKNFSSYILTVADLAEGRRTCGRGSAASSLVCYALGLTNVDPIRYQLLFERFLSPERIDPPDIDIDFPWDERDAVLASAIQRYGGERVAMVATHLHLKRWSALREVARAYGIASDEISRARMLLDREERFGIPACLPPPWPTVCSAAAAIVGTPRHLGLHCGGIVITREPIRDLVPVHPSAKAIALSLADGAATENQPPFGADGLPLHHADGSESHLPTIAWEKDGAEEMGLVKIDLLGNRSLAVVRDCVRDLREDGLAIDEAHWNTADDPATQKLIASGDTLGCFYIESPATRQLQAKAASPDFDRLVVHSSIIRPAALQWVNTYLERLHDYRAHGLHRDEWYPHPALRGLLSESFGVLSYQEDVMLVAQHIAGFDSASANRLRKALGFFDTTHRLKPLEERFVSGARANGVSEALIRRLWDMIMSFSGYSFCKAHSASYAMVSFQCAWLKAHHPAHFFANVIANEGGFYRPAVYLEAARRLGIDIRGPCVLTSDWLTRRANASAIRCGFHLAPGISRRVAERIAVARRERPFHSLRDLRQRAELGAAALDALARCGALDALLPNRNDDQRRWLAASVGLETSAGKVRDQQTTWWEEDDPLADPEPPSLAAPASREISWRRFHALGFLPEAHPLTLWNLREPRLRCRDVTPAKAKRRLSLVAWPITCKQVEAHTAEKPGRPAATQAMAFVTCEDETGLVETVWFPAAYRAYGALIDAGRPLRLSGVVEVSFGVATLTIERVAAVDPEA